MRYDRNNPRRSKYFLNNRQTTVRRNFISNSFIEQNRKLKQKRIQNLNNKINYILKQQTQKSMIIKPIELIQQYDGCKKLSSKSQSKLNINSIQKTITRIKMIKNDIRTNELDREKIMLIDKKKYTPFVSHSRSSSQINDFRHLRINSNYRFNYCTKKVLCPINKIDDNDKSISIEELKIFLSKNKNVVLPLKIPNKNLMNSKSEITTSRKTRILSNAFRQQLHIRRLSSNSSFTRLYDCNNRELKNNLSRFHNFSQMKLIQCSDSTIGSKIIKTSNMDSVIEYLVSSNYKNSIECLDSSNLRKNFNIAENESIALYPKFSMENLAFFGNSFCLYNPFYQA